MKSFSIAVIAAFPIHALGDIQAEIEAEIESRKTWTTETVEGAVNKCCYGGSRYCDDSCTQDWCATSHYHCAYCSKGNALQVGSVDGLARLLTCGGAQQASTGPSSGPGVDETNQETLITGDGRPDESEWPEGHSPQCCWGGCLGSCEHTHLWCSQSGSVCRDCAAQQAGGLQPEYHMCPGGTKVTKEQYEDAHIPPGQEFRCCWKERAHHTSASCDNCDSTWCSESWDQCSDCAGEMKLCTGADITPTLAPGDVVPTGAAVPEGKSWQCCWGGQCGESLCNPADTWCSMNTDQCGKCAGVMSLCDIPPAEQLPDDATMETESPVGTEWTCCRDDHCGECYEPRNWCSESNSNCQECNAHMFACPSVRRLVDQSALSMAASASVALPVVVLAVMRV